MEEQGKEQGPGGHCGFGPGFGGLKELVEQIVEEAVTEEAILRTEEAMLRGEEPVGAKEIEAGRGHVQNCRCHERSEAFCSVISHHHPFVDPRCALRQPARICNQRGCSIPAAFTFSWLGRPDVPICREHAVGLRAITAALGIHHGLVPIDPESERGRGRDGD